MKKILLSVVAICMMAVATVSAQEFNFGAKVGMNVSGITKSDSEMSSRIGMAIGLMSEYKFSDKTAVSLDLIFSQQGNKYKEDDVYDKSNLSYLNIPILFNYYIVGGLAVKAGVQPGFLLSAKYKYDWGSGFDGDVDIKDGCNTLDFSIPVGVSYDFGEHLVVDARYAIGMTDIGKDGDGKNKVFTLSVGYKF